MTSSTVGGMRDAEAAQVDVVRVRDLTVTAGGRVLLEHTQMLVKAGELVLLLGPSGSGKSILLQLLASVLHPSPGLGVEGEIWVAGSQVLPKKRGNAPSVGLVFQDHALLDDLTPAENLELALDHRTPPPDSARRKAEVQALLYEFGLSPTTPVRSLSGGQRQRLAVARTLAQDPDILIYDEPTTGLDPALAQQVAARIDQTHRGHSKTSLVVTHDTRALLKIADRVLLLDPAAKTIREVNKEHADQALAALAPPDDAPALVKRGPGRVVRFLHGTSDAAWETLRYVASLIPTWPRPRWGLRFLLHSLRLVTFPSAILYMATAGLILGFVATYFTFEYLPQRKYTEALLIDEILAGLGYLLFRVLGPVLATILMAARCGAAVAADTGNRTLGRQLDALHSLGVPPARYLFTATSLAFLIGAPILAGTLFVCARAVSEVVFLYGHPEHSPFFWDQSFHKLLLADDGTLWRGTLWTLLKVEAAGAGVAAVAWHQGTKPKASGAAVANGITRTIIWATLWVLAVHFVFALFEF